MSRVEVLVATMHQKDFSLFEKMNIQTDVIFCNQSDENKIEETEINGCRVRMISTTTRGVSINRNLGMQLSNAEFCLFADDDIRYIDGYEKIICDAFDKYKMPVIVFNFTSSGNDSMSNYTKKNGITTRTFGSPRIAINNKKVGKLGICFSHIFGPGSCYSNGEDSLFCRMLIRHNIKIYRVTDIIGNIDYSGSTWFKGYTEKYIFDIGAYCRSAYPKFWRMIKYYYILQQMKHYKMSLAKMVKLFNYGAKAYLLNLSYDEFMDLKNGGNIRCKH